MASVQHPSVSTTTGALPRAHRRLPADSFKFGHPPLLCAVYRSVFLCVWGNACVLFVCVEFRPLVLNDCYNCETFHPSLLSSLIVLKERKTKQHICEIQQNKGVVRLNWSIVRQLHPVKLHQEGTRAHQGWILDLMIRVDQSVLCFSISDLLILRCQRSVSRLVKNVCLTTSESWRTAASCVCSVCVDIIAC